MGWKEIWRYKEVRNEIYLNGFYDEKGELIKGEFFIEQHGYKRTITLSIGLNQLQLKSLLKILQIDLQGK